MDLAAHFVTWAPAELERRRLAMTAMTSRADEDSGEYRANPAGSGLRCQLLVGPIAGQLEWRSPILCSGGTLVTTIPLEPTVIDLQSEPNAGLDALLPYLFDTLVVKNVDDRIVPSLAESWQIDQDGNRLAARAVQYTFERFKQSGMISPICGSVQKTSSSQVADDATVRFTFEGSADEFWNAMASPHEGISSPESAELAAKKEGGYVVGSGPFMPASTPDGELLTLIRHVGYQQDSERPGRGAPIGRFASGNRCVTTPVGKFREPQATPIDY